MEADGVTRLYYHNDRPHRIVEAWPNPTRFREKDWTVGAVAQTAYEQADFKCVSAVNARDESDSEWIVHPKDKSIGECKLPYLFGDSSRNCAALAEKLEALAGKRGLTVIIF